MLIIMNNEYLQSINYNEIVQEIQILGNYNTK